MCPLSSPTKTHFAEVVQDVFCFPDICQVYVIVFRGRDGVRHAVAVDFGSGDVLDHLWELGLTGLDAILMTHHHRDQGQGLRRAVERGIDIFVPPVEQELFSRVDEMWESRKLRNDYNLQQDRFSLLDPVPIAGAVTLYRDADYGGLTVRAVPTPGHTLGSVSYLIERPEGLLAFTGDLIYSPGRVWSLAATQWSYTGSEGPAMTVLSALLLRREAPRMLLPSHGEVMHQADGALDLLAQRMQVYVDSRRLEPWNLTEWLDQPFEVISPHLLQNRTANSCSYVLLSDTGAALFIDYGYDMSTGWPPASGRASRLPWLASLPALKRNFGVSCVEVALVTHYHDDHVAGLNLLRETEGTQVWIPEHVAPILAEPMATDLPCQWFDPIPADRVLPLGGSVDWHEYTITTHDLPGHTRFAAAFEVEVDGVRVMATGDQQTALAPASGGREVLNYQYRNRFRPADYPAGAELYRRIAPGLFVTGHWGARAVDTDYVDTLARQGKELVQLHENLLPNDSATFGDSGPAQITPFLCELVAGQQTAYRVHVRNPFGQEADADVGLVLPDGWAAEKLRAGIRLPAEGSGEVRFTVTVGRDCGRRYRIAADLTIGGVRFGQVADAVADIVAPSAPRTGGG